VREGVGLRGKARLCIIGVVAVVVAEWMINSCAPLCIVIIMIIDEYVR